MNHPLAAKLDSIHERTPLSGPARDHADIGSRTVAVMSPREFILVALVGAVGMFVWRAETLYSPPFQDQAVGMWLEADFLAESNFDFYALRYREGHYMDLPEAGVRSYMISIAPAILAVLLKVCPSPTWVVVITRLLSFAFGGVILAQVYAAVRPRAGRAGSGLIALALGVTPLFITQVEIVGLDVFLTVPVLVSAFLLARDRFVAAAFMSLLAFFVKATGQLLTLTGITYLILLLLLVERGNRSFRGKCWVGLAVHVFVAAFETFITWWGDTSAGYMSSGLWPKAFQPPMAIWWLTPDIALLLLFNAIMSSLIVYRWCLARSLTRLVSFSRVRRLFFAGLRSGRLVVISWILVAGMLASARLVFYMPRYFTCATPFVFIILGHVLFVGRYRWALARLVFPALIAFNFANSSGAFLVDIDAMAERDFRSDAALNSRSCMFVERSREYLAEHRSNIAAIQMLEERFPNHPIFVETPNLFLMKKPRMAHVTKPLRVVNASDWRSTLECLREMVLSARPGQPESQPIFVRFGKTRITLPPPEPGDEILFNDGDRWKIPLLVYRKHIPDEARGSARAFDDWFLDQTWGSTWLVNRLMDRGSFLFDTGRGDRLLREARQARQWDPTDPTLSMICSAIEQTAAQHSESTDRSAPDR